MDPLERLVAIQEIRDQIARYAIFFDDKNWDGFAELWADDAAFVGPGMAFEGKPAVLDFLVSREPITTLDAFAPPPNGCALPRSSGINHLIVLTTAFRTSHTATTPNGGNRISTTQSIGASRA